MRLLSALLKPTAGTAVAAGFSVIDKPDMAVLFLVMDLGIVLWANRLFDRERLFSRR